MNFPQAVFENEGGGAGGGTQQAAGGGNQAAAGGGQQPPAGGGGNQPPAWKAPQGLPDHVTGKDAAETLDRLLPVYTGLRNELANRGAVPKDAGGYELKFSDTASPLLNLQNDDKVVPILKAAMHKHGITDKQSGFVSDLVDGIIGAGLIPKPVNPNELWKEMAGASFRGSDIEKIAEGQKLAREAQSFIDGLKGQQGWDEGMVNELSLLNGSAAGLRIIKQFMGSGVVKSATPGGAGAGGAVTKAEIDARRQDPRNSWGTAKYDPKFAEETETMYKRLYPG